MYILTSNKILKLKTKTFPKYQSYSDQSYYRLDGIIAFCFLCRLDHKCYHMKRQ